VKTKTGQRVEGILLNFETARQMGQTLINLADAGLAPSSSSHQEHASRIAELGSGSKTRLAGEAVA
jgi:hypothetical protein